MKGIFTGPFLFLFTKISTPIMTNKTKENGGIEK